MSEATESVVRMMQGKVPVPSGAGLRSLVKALKGEFAFKHARTVLALSREEVPGDTWVAQQLALCTYKDEELPPDARFDEALTVLATIGLLDPKEAVDSGRIPAESLPETLALAGAVYKRRWEHGGQLESLHQSLGFYRAAWERDPEKDMGYGGVNAAFILDIIASRVRTIAVRCGMEPQDAKEANRLDAEAKALREEILSTLNALAKDDQALRDQDWFLVTLAEVHFGLRNYAEAGALLADAAKLDPSEWEQQTTFKQLVSLARLQGHAVADDGTPVDELTPVWQALHQLLPGDAGRALSCYRGKVGLALSGGGFRASLFHLGVLARLAETDILRSVEVISTVSGGSIVGAHYYLELQALLEAKADADITCEDYVTLVKRVQDRFLAGVQKNVRTRAVASLERNLRMIFTDAYSRSHRLGELYESEIYALIGEDDGTPRTTPRRMPELMIDPSGEGFNPKFSNWRRRAKVPVLLLNATSLNSGHSWQFTARSMGEPPAAVGMEVDVNERYRRLWYEDAPSEEHRNYRLGHAVAASSCVPGLFEPLVLEGLYPGRTVRLVDGGVHDNQGVEALLAEGCTRVLCSDASGQMEDLKRPPDSVVGVPLRSNSILMDRVREAEYQDLKARVENRSLQGLFFIHLKQDLEALPIDWTECQDPTVPPDRFSATTAYGVDRDLQRRLASLRTDLDSFSEVEAYSLMLSGYLMAEQQFVALQDQHERDREPGTWGDYDIAAPRGSWTFLALEHLIRQPPDSADARRQELERQLAAGAAGFFKIWKLSPKLRGLALLIAAAVLLAVVLLARAYWHTPVPLVTMTWGGLILALALAVAGIISPLVKWLTPQQAVRGYVSKFVVAVVGYVGAQIHLRIFDRMFIEQGKLARLLKLP